MQNTLKEALQACAVFNIEGDSTNATKLAFLPGIYSAMTMVKAGEEGSKVPVVSFTDPTNLKKAGYDCDQVADEDIPGSDLPVVITRGNSRSGYRDFLNTVQRVGINVTKIVIQNKVPQAQSYANDIFDQEIEIARTAIGAKGGTDFIQLQNYVSVNAYDRSKITIDLSEEPLYLTPEVFMAMNIPANASFSIQFFFEAPALG